MMFKQRARNVLFALRHPLATYNVIKSAIKLEEFYSMLQKEYGFVMLPNGHRVKVTGLNLDEIKVQVYQIYALNIYERCFAPRKDDVVFDLGACIGLWTLKAAALVGGKGRVVAFEPEPNNMRRLRENLALNSLTNVFAMNIALSDFDGSALLYSYEGHIGLHTLERKRPFKARELRVSVRRLDTVIDELELDHVDFVKMDVEGSDLKVLKGAKRSLEAGVTKKLVIAQEHSEYDRRHCKAFLKRLGYKTKEIWVLGYPLLYAWKI